MFKTIDINLDFKDLEMIKNSLSNQIEDLEKQNFVGELKNEIDEYKQLLKKVNKKIDFILGNNQ
ncbi:hypothetical protein [Aliarcobacter butzleri]|uniref:Uncharacterized protein n=1 Tax=Aliarcobacter butzleri L352 TaxID=1447260 RepID=A0A837JFS5_9BACT|nr:hypothetical protein [Aliarcobacter butzleri]KLE06517.1 hypothetical protein AF78_03055 [Aliarcobacter butzleri L353]KLE06943.1 hypothetical protein AF77_00285 [Aliarcobacter butzleri L352]MCG3705801.1 hypothetical protein [Aliarcobacter butzleri]MCT7536524.1 hypothetical protein [Aliarcobacter butzleri]MCT7575298.1 hypothetical protein [Aliarcobacter butzleri]